MSPSKRNFEIEALLGQLASILSKNLITNSFPIGQAKEPLSIILKNGKAIEEDRTRNILVVGAGATYNANPKLQMATDAIVAIREAFKREYNQGIIKLIDNKIDELSRVFKLTSADFETQLLAFSLVDKTLVVSELESLYKTKYITSLFYEIVAHLFKHRFIDVIINFNFDEILDNAIEEEMFDSHYKYIFSDGHCPDKENMADELLHDNRLIMPIYIKPHGTISHPSTLRFTRQAYYETPSKITDTIIHLIAGDAPGLKAKLPINLIIAGFGMKSHEFNYILSTYLAADRAKVFYFDKTSNDKKFSEKFKDEAIHSFNEFNSFLFPILDNDCGNMSLDDWFYLLWDKIQELFNDPFQPKGISRHVIVHEVFNPMTKYLIDGTYSLSTYFKDRVMIELAIEILCSSDGLINLRQIKESRVQKYYSLYKRKDPNGMSLFSFLEDYELKRYKGYIKDTWFYEKENIDFTKSITQTFQQNISTKLRENFSNIKNVKRLFDYRKKMAMSKKLFLNIQFTPKDNPISVFQKITTSDIINTDIKWIYTFRQYFTNDKLRQKWNLILSISETGGIFSTEGVKEYLENKKLMLICSYNAINADRLFNPKHSRRDKLLNHKLAKIKSSILNNDGIPELRMLPFRNHNQHIVLFANVSKTSRSISFVGGIYYGRRDMSKRVTPIHINVKEDLIELFRVFLNYWERACKDDNVDKIKQAILTGQITSDIKSLAGAKAKSEEEIKEQIINIYCEDGTAT